MIKLKSARQQKVYDLLCEIAADNTLKISNEKLAQELFARKGMSGFDGKPISAAAMGAYLAKFKKDGLIVLKPGETTRDRIICLIK